VARRLLRHHPNHTADVISYAENRTPPAARDEAVRLAEPFDPAGFAGTDCPTMDAATSFPYTPVVDPAEANVKVPAWPRRHAVPQPR
jgi:hypothetical protein